MYEQWLASEDRDQFISDLNIPDPEKLEQLKQAMNEDCKKIRELQYPPAADYLDGIVKNDTDQINAYIQSCNNVKLQYPKVT